jgi:hypothetical protein
VLGTHRAALEEFSPWTRGRGHAAFAIVPGDFDTNGPHRLVLQARVRTAGLTDSWELELPHVPFNLEFDPFLKLDAITALADSDRGTVIEQAIRLEQDEVQPGDPATFLPLGPQWTIRNPPRLAVTTPLPCDLAHAIYLEFEGIERAVSAGMLVLSGQGTLPRGEHDLGVRVQRIPLGEIGSIDPDLFDRAGRRRARVVLQAVPERGWADPEIRSIWPGRAQTNWVEVEIVRR